MTIQNIARFVAILYIAGATLWIIGGIGCGDECNSGFMLVGRAP